MNWSKSMISKSSFLFLGIVLGLSLMGAYSKASIPQQILAEESSYIWTDEKSAISEEYFNYLNNLKLKLFEETLEVTNEELLKHLNSTRDFYNLCINKNKVAEIERIISDFDKEYAIFEMTLLTGSEESALQELKNADFDYKFEEVLNSSY